MQAPVTIGSTSGNLTVISLLPDHFNPSGIRYQRVRVLCSCGHQFDIHADRIREKKSTRCPRCVRAPQRRYKVGDVFDQLTVLNFETEKGTNRRIAICQCSCGKMVPIFTGLFQRNKKFNCGCQPLPSFKGSGEMSGAFFYNLKAGAKTRGLSVEVTKEELWNLFLKQERRCALSGLPLCLQIRGGRTDASVDRIDSTKSYTLDNVQWVHKDVNKMKQNLLQSHFLELCRRITEHQDGIPPMIISEPPTTSPPRRKPPGRPKTNTG